MPTSRLSTSAAASVILCVMLLWPMSVTLQGSRSSIAPFYYDAHNACTAFAINEAARLWVTAAHCIATEPVAADPESDAPTTPTTPAAAHTFHIQDQLAVVAVVFGEDDLAILQTPKGAPGLRLAGRGPQTGDLVKVFGFPLGGEQSIAATGTVANPSYTIKGYVHPFAWFAIPVCYGHSGSPVLDKRGDLVSVFQKMPPTEMCGSYALGPTWETLTQTIGGLFEPR